MVWGWKKSLGGWTTTQEWGPLQHKLRHATNPPKNNICEVEIPPCLPIENTLREGLLTKSKLQDTPRVKIGKMGPYRRQL